MRVAGEIDDSFVGTWRQAYPEVPVRIEVIDERPAQALLEWSADAALLVVGSHRHGAAGRVLLGSVSHAALYHSACPVAVLRGPTEESC